MEKTQTFFEGICDLCQIPHNQIEPISFTCNHNLCLNCLPYLFYNSIQHSLFIYELKECPCPFCENGYTKLPFQDLMTKISYPPPIYESQSKISSLRCDYCENESSLICNDCQMNYCTNCLTSFHNNLKKNKSHHMVTHEIKEKNSVFKCGCEQNKPAKNFCKTCKIAICNICSQKQHKDHHQEILFMILKRAEDLESRKNFFQKLREDFQIFHANILKALKKNIDDNNMDFCNLIDQIFSLMKKIKEKNNEAALLNYQKLNDKFNLIEKSFFSLSEDLEKHETLPPTKLYYLNNFFLNDINQEMTFPDFHIKMTENLYWKGLKNIMTEILSKETEKNFDLSFEIPELNLNKPFEIQEINPIELFSQPPILLEKRSFYVYGWKKANISTTFVLDDDIFLMTPLSKTQDAYPLQVYNISKRKREYVIKGTGNYISVISSFITNEKKWVYCGDAGSVLRVFDVSNKEIKEIYRIKTTLAKGIASIQLFEDKFKVLSTENIRNYAVVSFLDANSPIEIYDLKNGSGSVIRTIDNPGSNLCLTLNYFHDLKKNKTCFFFGFSKSAVRMYDLKQNTWTKSFQTLNIVTALQFLEDENGRNLIIFTQRNSGNVIIADIETEKIVRSENINDVSDIYDICFAGKKNEFIVLGGINEQQKGVLKVLDLELKVLLSKNVEFQYESPINLIRVCLKEKESFVVCSYGGECSTVIYG